MGKTMWEEKGNDGGPSVDVTVMSQGDKRRLDSSQTRNLMSDEGFKSASSFNIRDKVV